MYRRTDAQAVLDPSLAGESLQQGYCSVHAGDVWKRWLWPEGEKGDDDEDNYKQNFEDPPHDALPLDTSIPQDCRP